MGAGRFVVCSADLQLHAEGVREQGVVSENGNPAKGRGVLRLRQAIQDPPLLLLVQYLKGTKG